MRLMWAPTLHAEIQFHYSITTSPPSVSYLHCLGTRLCVHCCCYIHVGILVDNDNVLGI